MLVEGAIVFPIIILSAFLLIRMFVFCLEILDTGICEHHKALEEWDSYNGIAVRVYTENTNVSMFRGGLLDFNLVHGIDTKSYLINEDFLVRAGEVID